MNQRDKDYQHARSMCLLPVTAYAFADGAEYGRRDQAAQQAAPLAKLERLLRAGWEVYVTADGGFAFLSGQRYMGRGATLAEALAQVLDGGPDE